MKNKALLPIILLATFALVGCNAKKTSSEGQSSQQSSSQQSSETSSQQSSESSSEQSSESSSSSEAIQYGVAISNKEALQADWYSDDSQRTLEIALTPAANVLREIAAGNLVIESSDPEIVSVSGVAVAPVAEGDATITVTYHGETDTVALHVKSADERPEPAHEAATVAKILQDIKDGREKKVIYEIEVYVVAWQSGKTDATKYGNYMVADTKDAAKESQLLVYGSSANAEAFTFTWKGGEYSYTQGDAAKDFLTNALTKDVYFGSKLTMQVIGYSYSGTPEISGIITAVDHSEREEKPDIPEPAVVTDATLASFLADKQGNGKQAFEFTTTVKYFKTADAEAAEEYGNLTVTDGENDLVVYGSTATATALQWDAAAGQYSFKNPKDFTTNALTKDIKLGDQIKVRFIRSDYTKDGTTTIQGQGIILEVNGEGGGGQQTVNYGTEEAPLTVSEALTEVAKLGLENKAYSPNYFFVSAKLKAAMVNGGSSYKFTLTDDTKDMDVSSAQVEDGKTEADYMAGDVLLVRAYARADSSKTNGFYLSYNNSGEDGKQAPQVLACTPVERPSVTGITLNPSEAFSLKAGAHKTINYTLAPEGAEGEVEWTVAPADGKLTVEDGYVTVANDAVAETVYTVTASVKNTALSASVQITIAAGTLEEQNVTITPSDAEAIAESPFEIVKSGIKVSCTNGTITADQIRVFKGQTLTVSGAEIKSIVLTCTATGAAKYGPGSIEATGYTFEAEGNTGTWTGLAEVVNLLASGNQARITSIVVTYLA